MHSDYAYYVSPNRLCISAAILLRITRKIDFSIFDSKFHIKTDFKAPSHPNFHFLVLNIESSWNFHRSHIYCWVCHRKNFSPKYEICGLFLRNHGAKLESVGISRISSPVTNAIELRLILKYSYDLPLQRNRGRISKFIFQFFHRNIECKISESNAAHYIRNFDIRKQRSFSRKIRLC